jgi:hypothetical protein
MNVRGLTDVLNVYPAEIVVRMESLLKNSGSMASATMLPESSHSSHVNEPLMLEAE